MTSLEERYPCPVCVGVRMSKLELSEEADLLLDSCGRCGGFWFDYGEVQQLRRCKPQVLWRKIVLQERARRMKCHSCHASMDRNASQCPVCGWKNVIDCPTCSRPLQPIEYEKLKLDICKQCKGVWFDEIELSEIWNLQIDSLAKKRQQASGESTPAYGDAASLFHEVLVWNPDLALYGAYAIAEAGQASVEVSAHALSHAPEVAGAAVEGTGELAAGVFEVIGEIICGIFELC